MTAEILYTQFRSLAHGLSLLFSIIMAIMLLVTSSLMANIYVKYCDYVKNNTALDNYGFPDKCGDNERHFLVLPLFGYFAMITWVKYL